MLNILAAIVKELLGDTGATSQQRPRGGRATGRQPQQRTPTQTDFEEAVRRAIGMAAPEPEPEPEPPPRPEAEAVPAASSRQQERRPRQTQAPRQRRPRKQDMTPTAFREPEPEPLPSTMAESSIQHVVSILDTQGHAPSGSPASSQAPNHGAGVPEFVARLRNNPAAAREAFVYAEIMGPPLADR